MRDKTISIWFFTGVLLVLYGVLILGAGVYALSHPPQVILPELHIDLWWGAFMTLGGALYCWKFAPGKE